MNNLNSYTSSVLDPPEWFGDEPRVTNREWFRRLGYEPPAPVSVYDCQLRGRLWELIYALAGQGIYLRYTNRLSDRTLYIWLCHEWLEKEFSGFPYEAEDYDAEDHILDMTDFNNGTDLIIWLIYYATEEQRLAFAAKHSLDAIPAHVNPPFDRDRWLPEPPGLVLEGDDEPFCFEEADEDEPSETDPLGLAKVDAAIAAEKNHRELATIGDPGLSENWQRPADELQRSAGTLLPPAELTDETLTAKLWELLHNLACHGFYVLHSDHLSDREVYSELWTRGLREEAVLSGKSRTSGWFHDFLGSRSEEDIQLSLRFYDDDEERADWARQYPEDSMPPKETPPFNRDWRLPKGPF